jgi:hypothetical protein
MEQKIMEQLRINNMDLEKVVSEVKDAGFEERYSLTTPERTWRMYARDSGEVLKVTYVSDYCEVIVTKTFKGLKDENTNNMSSKNVKNQKKQEQESIERILDRCQKGIGDTEPKPFNFELAMLYFAGGAIIGMAGRSPVTVIGGGVLGVAIYLSTLDTNPKKATKQLGKYLENHNIYIGDKAMIQLK